MYKKILIVIFILYIISISLLIIENNFLKNENKKVIDEYLFLADKQIECLKNRLDLKEKLFKEDLELNLSNQNLMFCQNALSEAVSRLNGCYDENFDLQNKIYYYETNYPEFLKIAEEVANSYEYNDTFKCVDFSYELVKRLEKYGYEAYPQKCYYENRPHMIVIVKIPIEATTGKIILPSDNYSW